MTEESFAPAPITAQIEICDNFFDDDGDGFVDAEDPESCSQSEGGENMTAIVTAPGEVITEQNMTTNELTVLQQQILGLLLSALSQPALVILHLLL